MILEELKQRSGNQCELCTGTDNLKAFLVSPKTEENTDNTLLVCNTCHNQITGETEIDKNHWHCLNDSMWSEHSPVKVVAWRMLNKIGESWSSDLLDMMYLEEEELTWAKSETQNSTEEKVVHRDVNGVVLEAGDTVVLIKDLPVKGSSMVAKRGTAVRRIALDPDNANFIEGRVDGQHIVIITEYVNKS